MWLTQRRWGVRRKQRRDSEKRKAQPRRMTVVLLFFVHLFLGSQTIISGGFVTSCASLGPKTHRIASRASSTAEPSSCVQHWKTMLRFVDPHPHSSPRYVTPPRTTQHNSGPASGNPTPPSPFLTHIGTPPLRADVAVSGSSGPGILSSARRLRGSPCGQRRKNHHAIDDALRGSDAHDIARTRTSVVASGAATY